MIFLNHQKLINERLLTTYIVEHGVAEFDDCSDD